MLRRIHPDHLIWDASRNIFRASSAAFDDVYDGVSVFLRSMLDAIGRSETDVLINYNRHSLVSFTAGAVRAFDPPLGVRRDPDPLGVPPHPCSPAHALVTGIPTTKAGKKHYRRPLAEEIATEFVVLREPPPTE